MVAGEAGDGIPLFPRRARSVQPLRLVQSRALKNGIVLVDYEPVRAPSAGRRHDACRLTEGEKG